MALHYKKLNRVYAELLLPIAFLLGLWALSYIKQPVDRTLLLMHVIDLSIQSTRLQLLFFVGSTGALGLACFFLLLKPKIGILGDPEPLTIPDKTALMTFFLAPFLLGEYSRSFATGFFSPVIFLLGFWTLYRTEPRPNRSLFLRAASAAALGMACIVLLLTPNLKHPGPITIFNRITLVSFFLVTFLFGVYSRTFAAGVLGILSRLLSAVRPSGPPFISRNFPRSASIAFILIYSAIFLVLPFFIPLIATNGGHFAFMDAHYASSILPGFDLARSHTVERSSYGFSTLMLTALAYKLASALGTQYTQLFPIVKSYQIVAVCLLLFAIYLLNKKRFLFISAVGLAATPSINTLDSAVCFPNQSGLRYIPFLIGIILLAWEMRRKKPGFLLLSAASALLLVLSPETGLALFCGFAVFLVLAGYNREAACATTLRTIGLFFVLTVFIFALFSNFLVHIFYKSTSPNLFSSVKLFSSGFGGYVSKPSVFATFLVFFGISAVIRGVLRARNGTASGVDAYQAGMGTIILTWLPYYVNRMREANLWFQAVLLLLLFAPRIGSSSLRFMSRKFNFGTFQMGLAVAVMCALLFSAAAENLGNSSTSMKFSCHGSTDVIKGFCFAGSDGPVISKKMDFLKGLAEKQDHLVLSYLPTQVRLLGFNSGFPWYDPYNDIVRDSDLKSLTAWIEAKAPRYILTDDPASAISSEIPFGLQFQQYVMNSLSSYRKLRSDSGWLIYEHI